MSADIFGHSGRYAASGDIFRQGKCNAGGGDILERIAARAARRAEEKQARLPLAEIARRAEELAEVQRQGGGFAFPFEAAILSSDFAFICECKRASPSKGLLVHDYNPVAIALDYEAAGASCISVLTEPDFFLGSGEHLRQVSRAVSLPCLRKDFVTSDYFIYEAKLLGASAVLLIAALLGESELAHLIGLCHSLGLSALVEVHSEHELEATLAAGARLVGINSRNLRDFSVDLGVVERLAALVPPCVLLIAESGIKTAGDVARVRRAGARGALIGETLMRASDRRVMLAYLREDFCSETS